MFKNRAFAAVAALVALFTFRCSASCSKPPRLAFKSTTNVSLYGKPTGMLIAGRCSSTDAAFASARAKGAEVLLYLAPAERPDNYVCALDNKFYMNDVSKVPLWPYPSYGRRYNWAGTHLTDMRAGSAWIQWVVKYVETLMREKKVDGVFLDVVGARLWSSASEWSSWSQTEKNAWTDGNVDLVRRLDAKRRAINPFFIIVNNNVWDRGDTRGLPAERYVDGITLEHPRASSTWHQKYVGKAFSNLGQRRVLVIANTRAEAQQWAKIPGVTHVSDQTTSQYRYPNPPAVSFQYLGDRD